MKLSSTKYIAVCILALAFVHTLGASQAAPQYIVDKAILRALTPRPPVPLFPTNTPRTVTTTKQEQEKESKKRHEYIKLPRGYKLINYVWSKSNPCMFIVAEHEVSAQSHLYAVFVYDREEQKYLACAIHPNGIIDLAIHPAGIYFATVSKTGTTGDHLQRTDTNTVAVWETLTGKPRKTWYNLTNISWVRFMQGKDGISFGGNPNPQESHPTTPRA